MQSLQNEDLQKSHTAVNKGVMRVKWQTLAYILQEVASRIQIHDLSII